LGAERKEERVMRKVRFSLDFSEAMRFASENTSARGEMYHCSPNAWRKERGLDIEFPAPTEEQIKRARKDYEEFIDIP